MSDEVKLLPCPFDGGEAHIIHDGHGYYRAQCKVCGTSVGEFRKRSECAPAWNRRTSPDGKLREALVAAAMNAQLPDNYQWGEDAMEAFNFGKTCAANAIEAALTALEAKGLVVQGWRFDMENAPEGDCLRFEPAEYRRGQLSLVERIVISKGNYPRKAVAWMPLPAPPAPTEDGR